MIPLDLNIGVCAYLTELRHQWSQHFVFYHQADCHFYLIQFITTGLIQNMTANSVSNMKRGAVFRRCLLTPSAGSFDDVRGPDVWWVYVSVDRPAENPNTIHSAAAMAALRYRDLKHIAKIRNVSERSELRAAIRGRNALFWKINQGYFEASKSKVEQLLFYCTTTQVRIE